MNKLSSPLSMRWGWLNWPAYARRTVTFAFILLVNWMLLSPAKTFEDVQVFFKYQDKLVHFGMFAVLAGLLRWSIPDPWGRGGKRIALILALIAYGATTECVQLLMPGLGRSFEWMDMCMDGIGVILGAWCCERLALSENLNSGF
ncbi:MAG: VanZ family protein [bacterium]